MVWESWREFYLRGKTGKQEAAVGFYSWMLFQPQDWSRVHVLYDRRTSDQLATAYVQLGIRFLEPLE